MNEIIEQMILMATENGTVPPQKQEMILKKAADLGEDLDKVKEALNIVQQSSTVPQPPALPKKIRRKCPHCGAVILDNALSCPECGYVFQQEEDSVKDYRALIAEFQKKLSEAEKADAGFVDCDDERAFRLITSFSLPTTKEGLMQMLEFAVLQMGRYEGEWEDKISHAWQSKANQAYSMLQRLARNDVEVADFLSYQKTMMDKCNTTQKKSKREGKFWAVVSFIIGCLMYYGIFCWIKSCQ